MSDEMANRFSEVRYIARRNFFNFLGITCRILSPSGALLFYIRLKAFKLKEDITIFSDETQTTSLLNIKARSIIDFSAAYDVVDTESGEKIGAFRRKGLKSILRDSWLILDVNDEEIGTLTESGSGGLALLRRLGGFGTLIMPQTFSVEVHGQQVASFRQRRNPFIAKLDLDFSMDSQQLLDRRMGIAAAILIGAIEGRQN